MLIVAGDFVHHTFRVGDFQALSDGAGFLGAGTPVRRIVEMFNHRTIEAGYPDFRSPPKPATAMLHRRCGSPDASARTNCRIVATIPPSPRQDKANRDRRAGLFEKEQQISRILMQPQSLLVELCDQPIYVLTCRRMKRQGQQLAVSFNTLVDLDAGLAHAEGLFLRESGPAAQWSKPR
jgi:hypothetical protein